MPRQLPRSSTGSSLHRDRASDRQRRRVSALSGHVDYIELAERVTQGVTVDDTSASQWHRERPRKPRRH